MDKILSESEHFLLLALSEKGLARLLVPPVSGKDLGFSPAKRVLVTCVDEPQGTMVSEVRDANIAHISPYKSSTPVGDAARLHRKRERHCRTTTQVRTDEVAGHYVCHSTTLGCSLLLLVRFGATTQRCRPR